MATDPRFPHWEDRRHGWEPVNKMPKIKTKKPLRFEYWQSLKNREWYWRIKAGNREIVAQGEGYKRKAGVLKVFHLLFDFEAMPQCVELNQANLPVVKKPKFYEGHINRSFP